MSAVPWRGRSPCPLVDLGRGPLAGGVGRGLDPVFPKRREPADRENDVPVDPRASLERVPVVRGAATVNVEGVGDGDAFYATVFSGGGR